MSDAWEKKLDARLKALPARRAPSAIRSGVLAAAALRALPWWRRPFWTWTPAAQAAFALSLAAAAAALWRFAPPIPAFDAAPVLAALGRRFDFAFTLARAFGRAAWTLRLPLALGFFALSTLATAPAAALAALTARPNSRRLS